jgi:repressor LexA
MISLQKELTAEQGRVLNFIISTFKKIGMPPTMREIAQNLGYKSVNNARQHLRLIEQKGYVRLFQGKARGIEILDKSSSADEFMVPLVGLVAAGAPITAQENISEYISLDRNMFRGDNLFTLKIRGDSMSGIGVLDGDIVIVRQQATAQNGEVVVAIIDGEATLKRFIREKERVLLKPENPAYEDIVVPSDKSLLIAGKMVGLLRKC